MIRNILLAVDDSAPALAAARTGVELAATCGARVRAVTVLTDGRIAEQLARTAGHDDSLATIARQSQTADAVLRHVARLAADADVPCETAKLDGEVAQRILQEADSWPADLVVIGRSDIGKPGQPYIGSHTRHVLEFAEQAVIVVPSRSGGG